MHFTFESSRRNLILCPTASQGDRGFQPRPVLINIIISHTTTPINWSEIRWFAVMWAPRQRGSVRHYHPRTPNLEKSVPKLVYRESKPECPHPGSILQTVRPSRSLFASRIGLYTECFFLNGTVWKNRKP